MRNPFLSCRITSSENSGLYSVAFEGEIWLELDDGNTVHLERGDVVVQNGARHTWRNKGTRPSDLPGEIKALSPTGRQRIGQHMLALATYLGHVNINATYWYLETTPELLLDIAVVAENLCREGGHDFPRTAHGGIPPRASCPPPF